MVAKDGLPFRVFETSTDLRSCLKAKGCSEELPTSQMTIKKLVVDYASVTRKAHIEEIKEVKKSGGKFSLTVDEWTSVSNKRYLNINIHASDKKFWNMGLTQIQGSLTSVVCLQLISKKLVEYDLTMAQDVVSFTTDGPSVMLKLGRIAPCHHQQCFAHGIHLAVTDVLYKSKGN